MLYSVELQTKLYTLRFSSKWIQQSRFLLKNMSRIVVSNLILLHYAMVFRKKIHARGLLEKILSCFHIGSPCENLLHTFLEYKGIQTSKLCLGHLQLSISFLRSSVMRLLKSPLLKRA